MTAINSNRAIRGPVTAVPVVAGTGVRFVKDVENNRVVAEVDETVLFDSNGAANISSCSFSESYKNFEKVKFYFINNDNEVFTLESLTSNQGTLVTLIAGTVSTEPALYMKASTYTLGNTTMAIRNSISYAIYSSGIAGISTAALPNYVLRVTGINRIASN